MTYNKFIQNILNTRGRFACSDGYHERHHIIPKCMNGSNSQDNLIDLYAREHFIAHKLLAEENPQNYQLKYAYWNMCQCTGRDGQDKYIPTPEEYEEARIFCYEAMSGENHPMYGKHHTQESREKMSISKKDMYNGENNPFFGKKHSQENIEKMKGTHSGKDNPKSRPVYCIELGIGFDSIGIASEKTGVNKRSISYCLDGTQKHAGKHPVTGELLTWVDWKNDINV